MQMIKELETVLDYVRSFAKAGEMLSKYKPNDIAYHTYISKEQHEKFNKAITTLDSILNQDESELVERAAVAIQSAYKRSINDDLSKKAIMVIINDGTPIGAAEDALRAVGLMKAEE
jgi:hypothetical protein